MASVVRAETDPSRSVARPARQYGVKRQQDAQAHLQGQWVHADRSHRQSAEAAEQIPAQPSGYQSANTPASGLKVYMPNASAMIIRSWNTRAGSTAGGNAARKILESSLSSCMWRAMKQLGPVSPDVCPSAETSESTAMLGT